MRLIDADQAICAGRLASFPAFGRSRADIADLAEFLDDCETVEVALSPNDPLTLNQLLEMDGEPVWTADGICYIVNIQTGYAVDMHRGVRMLDHLCEMGVYHRKPEENHEK